MPAVESDASVSHFSLYSSIKCLLYVTCLHEHCHVGPNGVVVARIENQPSFHCNFPLLTNEAFNKKRDCSRLGPKLNNTTCVDYVLFNVPIVS